MFISEHGHLFEGARLGQIVELPKPDERLENCLLV